MLRSTLVMGFSLALRRHCGGVGRKSAVKPRARTAPRGGRRGPSVAILRQFAPALASAAQAELVHLAVQRRAGHVEVLGGLRDVAAGTRQRALQNRPFGCLDPIVIRPARRR